MKRPHSPTGPPLHRRLPRRAPGATRDEAAELFATNIARLTNQWEAEYRAFQKRGLVDRDYVYVWVDRPPVSPGSNVLQPELLAVGNRIASRKLARATDQLLGLHVISPPLVSGTGNRPRDQY